MEANNVFAATAFIGFVALVALVVAGIFYDLEFIYVAIGFVIIVALISVILLYLGVGLHAMVKKKDQVHTNSSMTLDDVVEVDREMEKK